MAVRVRLTRVGSKKNPVWRIVVADQRSPRDGRFIEAIGHYNPRTEPSQISLEEERLRYWLARGAQPTGTVRKLIRAHAAGAVARAEAAPSEPPAPSAEAPGEPEAAGNADAAEGQAPGDVPPEAAGEGDAAESAG